MKTIGEGDSCVLGKLYELQATAYHGGEGSITDYKNKVHDLGSELGRGFPGKIEKQCFFEADSLEHAKQIAKVFIGSGD